MIKKSLMLLCCGVFLLGCHHESLQTIAPDANEIKALYDPAGTTPMGRADAPITMVELYSYDCRYCRQDYPLIEAFVHDHQNVRVIFKSFMAFGDHTQVLPQYAALAAGKQGQFLPMHRALITTNRRLTPRLIDRMAKELNLNLPKFHDDLSSSAVAQQIKDNTELMDNLGVDGIPAVVMTQTRLIGDPSLSAKVPEYLQVGFLSNDILLNLMRQVEKDAKISK